ncbi:putative ribosomal protein L32p [Plasmopara halstedii]
MLLRNAMECAVKLFQHNFLPTTQRPALILSPLMLNGASIAMPSDLLGRAIWLAAPKSKVTPSRKKIRNNDPTKRLKNIVHFQDCTMCGEKKLRHRLCMSCYKKGKYFV